MPKKQDTQSRVFESARILFNKWGYRGMTLRQIASDAGIEAQSIYNHTPSKQALVEKLLRDATAEMHNSVVAALAEADQAPTAQLAAGMKAHVIHYLSSKNVILSFRATLVHFDADTRASLQVMMKTYEQVFKNILRDGIASGEFVSVDITPTTFAILGLGDSVINWWSRDGRLSAEEVGEIYGALATRMVSRTPKENLSQSPDSSETNHNQ
jgi:AcrR family transcriptional regulator